MLHMYCLDINLPLTLQLPRRLENPYPILTDLIFVTSSITSFKLTVCNKTVLGLDKKSYENNIYRVRCEIFCLQMYNSTQ